jgi:hypothetical protein
MVAILVCPLLFVWLLFRPGCARSTRVAGLAYAFYPFVCALLVVGALAIVGMLRS